MGSLLFSKWLFIEGKSLEQIFSPRDSFYFCFACKYPSFLLENLKNSWIVIVFVQPHMRKPLFALGKNYCFFLSFYVVGAKFCPHSLPSHPPLHLLSATCTWCLVGTLWAAYTSIAKINIYRYTGRACPVFYLAILVITWTYSRYSSGHLKQVFILIFI